MSCDVMEAGGGLFYQRSLTGTDGGATPTVAPAPEPTGFTHLSSAASQRTPPTVAPAPEPGPSLGPGGSFSG